MAQSSEGCHARPRLARLAERAFTFLVLMVLLGAAACASTVPAPPQPVIDPNLDVKTRALIDRAQRAVFIIPFSHWDTDWHEAFPEYVKRSDQNILNAIQLAKQATRFRYTIEQVLFAQHFWDNYPQYRDDLKALIQNRQITFAWGGITQPETSLVAHAIQEHNLQLGQEWITNSFGREYVPRSAWQSDAFGNSAAFPIFLSRFNVPYLFIGRAPRRCDANRQNCVTLPHVFYWRSPARPDARILVAYTSYPAAWDAIHKLTDEKDQIAALRKVVDDQFSRTTSRYIFLPMGSDFVDPVPNMLSLIDQWNAVDPSTVLVMSDPDTAFQYLATQNLPELTVDLNPLWQAFYASRPAAKIADKTSEYYLTASDDFGRLMNAPQSSAWYTATINAHYDNIGAVGFDAVWKNTQRPRFEQTVVTAAQDLSSILARIAGQTEAPVVVFNPSHWPRSGIVELEGNVPDADRLPSPVQHIGSNAIAFRVTDVPPIGYLNPIGVQAVITHLAAATQSNTIITLANGLVTATLDANHGGAFAGVLRGDKEILSGFGDDITYFDGGGDIYGARFGEVRSRESTVPAQVTVLANGPLIARAQVVFRLNHQPITKTITLRADDPAIEVALQIKALPESTAIAQTPTTINTNMRTDDLGFITFTHPIDSRPIISGDITYRRDIFYPIMYWSDVSAHDVGLSLITHGLQGLGGTNILNLMLVRQVTDPDGEGVTDAEYHTLHYAYLPHVGSFDQSSNVASDFNQPLIAVVRSGAQTTVHLPFCGLIVLSDHPPRCNDR